MNLLILECLEPHQILCIDEIHYYECLVMFFLSCFFLLQIEKYRTRNLVEDVTNIEEEVEEEVKPNVGVEGCVGAVADVGEGQGDRSEQRRYDIL